MRWAGSSYMELCYPRKEFECLEDFYQGILLTSFWSHLVHVPNL